MASILEKAGCDHVKTAGEASFSMVFDDMKAPSKNVLNAARRFFFELWNKGDRQLAALEVKVYTRNVRL
jgi:hypothetical protein